ncbi:MAG: NTP transferase domain-containing protein [Candidatus Methanomethylophilus sp.]|nr:NTP transferase domain-containing protein [Methanomethylophilus sp.]MDD3232876.1 NTP transferase domain-containing protein [Methanomethylophilus sp.]MDD4222475.1 NTP transferase domain-containing protein [Methanomethylophilus sp.]MDD4668777.1 NTP transferase domain-containing protein [Methanomethylophilus sp.]
MEALINAGGKGTRMGLCGIEKPMQVIGSEPAIHRVVTAVRGAAGIDRVLVSVSSHTQATERYLQDLGVETVRTSGEDFMGDLHEAFTVMNGKYVFTCPSDIPLLTSPAVTQVVKAFDPV